MFLSVIYNQTTSNQSNHFLYKCNFLERLEDVDLYYCRNLKFAIKPAFLRVTSVQFVSPVLFFQADITTKRTESEACSPAHIGLTVSLPVTDQINSDSQSLMPKRHTTIFHFPADLLSHFSGYSLTLRIQLQAISSHLQYAVNSLASCHKGVSA